LLGGKKVHPADKILATPMPSDSAETVTPDKMCHLEQQQRRPCYRQLTVWQMSPLASPHSFYVITSFRSIVSFSAYLTMLTMLKAIPSMTYLSVCLSVTLWWSMPEPLKTSTHTFCTYGKAMFLFSCRRLSQS